MQIQSWQGRLCDCRPECDAERATATVRCTNCGAEVSVRFADEGSAVRLDEWFGGDDASPWHLQVWSGGKDGYSLNPDRDIQLPSAGQWMDRIGDLLDEDAYIFKIPGPPA